MSLATHSPARERPLGKVWEDVIAAEELARQSTERARRDTSEGEAVFTIRDSLQHRFHAARANTGLSLNDGSDEERDPPSGLQEGVQELNARLPSPRTNAPRTPPRQTITAELPAHCNVRSPLSFTADDMTASDLESEIQRQKVHIKHVEVQISKKDFQIRELLNAKEATEEAHLQAILNGQQREIESLERIKFGLVEQLRTARAEVKQLDTQVVEGRAREDALRRQMHEKERQMDDRERHCSLQIHNAKLGQMQAEADLEAARISSRLVAETTSQSSQPSQSQRRSSTSHRPSSTSYKFSVPRGSRDAPIVAELFKRAVR